MKVVLEELNSNRPNVSTYKASRKNLQLSKNRSPTAETLANKHHRDSYVILNNLLDKTGTRRTSKKYLGHNNENHCHSPIS